jgi:hypothetical protein
VFSKINVTALVVDHLNTLTGTEGKRLKGDIAVFFAIPLVTAVALVYFKVTLSDNATGMIINALAIFAGLLLNLLVLVHGLIRKYKSDDLYKDARRLLRELYSNIAYGVLTCILGLIGVLTLGFITNVVVRSVVTGLIFFVVFNFLLTMLMILKRVHLMLTHAFKYPGPSGGG